MLHPQQKQNFACQKQALSLVSLTQIDSEKRPTFPYPPCARKTSKPIIRACCLISLHHEQSFSFLEKGSDFDALRSSHHPSSINFVVTANTT